MGDDKNLLKDFWGIKDIEEDIFIIEDLKNNSIYCMDLFGVSGPLYFKYLDNTNYVEVLDWDSDNDMFNYKNDMSKKELFQLINSFFTPHIYETFINDISYYIYYYGYRVGYYETNDEYFLILDTIYNKYEND